MMTISDKIPKARFNYWLSLFGTTDGRFVSKPYESRDYVWVHYTMSVEDNNQMNQFWNRINTPIVEKHSSRFKRFKNRLKSFLFNK